MSATWLAVGCLAIAALFGVVGPLLLRESSWSSEHPRAAITSWHSCACGLVLAVVSAMLLLAHDVWEHALLSVTALDKAGLHQAYAGDVVVDARWNVSMVVVAVLAIVLLVHWLRLAVDLSRARRAQRRLPGLRRQSLDRLQVLHVRDTRRLVFCVPGSTLTRRAGLIVVSDTAWDALSPRERDAVLAHERCHLDRGHHRSVQVAEVFGACWEPLRLLEGYRAEVRQLVEMEADDHAVREHGERPVARAILTLATDAGPLRGSLAMGRSVVVTRVRRLLAGDRARSQCAARLVSAGIGCAAPLLPLALLTLPLSFVGS